MPLDYTYDRTGVVELLKEHVKGDRLRHCLGVEQTAVDLAKRYGADESKAGLAGLLHDVTKQMDNEKLKQKYEVLSPTEKTLHGPTAAAWLRAHDYVTDEDILSAIRYHTTGRPSMSLLEKIIFIADAIEPGRRYPEVELLRDYASEDLDKAVLLALERQLHKVLNEQGLIDPDTVAAYNDYRTLCHQKEKD